MTKITEKQLRMKQRAIQISRFRTRLAASPIEPRVPDAIAPDNLISSNNLYTGLNVEIDKWESQGDEDIITLIWNNNTVGTYEIEDVDQQTFPIHFTVPATMLRNAGDGYFELYYTIERASGSVLESIRVSTRIDTTVPNRDKTPASLEFPTDLITTEYLYENNDEVIATVPGYSDMEAGQTVSMFWNVTPISSVEVSADDVENNEVPIAVSGDIIRAVGEGSIRTYYYVTSRAGIEGKNSDYALIDVLLQPVPSDILAPIIPLAEDGLITLSDADAGITIEIDTYLNYASGDIVKASWGGEPLTQTTVQANSFPLEIAVPRYIVLNTGSKDDLAVEYRVVRNNYEFQSPTTEINVDVDYVGPRDPDTTTVVNEALPAPTVKGASGTENELVPADAGEPATVTVAFYEGAAAGQIVSLYWGTSNNEPQEYTLEEADITAESIPDFSIDAETVADTPNGDDFPVFYTLSRAVDDPPSNPVRSMTQLVAVSISSPRNLSEVELPGVNQKGWLLYGAVKDGCEVNVPVYEGMELNDIVQLTWQSYNKTNAADGTEIEDTFYESDEVTVTADELANGISFLVPYVDYIEPISTVSGWQGAARINYQVTQKDIPYSGPEKIVKIDLSEGPY